MTTIRNALAALPLLLCALLIGCGNNAVFLNAASTPAISHTGNWSFIGNDEVGGTNIYLLNFGGSLINTGGQISGVFHINSSCFGDYSTDVPYTGTLDSKNKLNITSSAISGQILTLHGTLAPDYSTLDDISFSIIGGCSGNLVGLTGSDGAGGTLNPTGSRIPNLTGSWTAASGSIGPALTEELTQSSTPDAHGDFALSGNVNVENSPCFTEGSIQPASLVSGNLGQQVILMNDGSVVSATLQVIPGMDNSAPTKPTVALTSGSITGGNCNGIFDLTLQ